MSPYELTYPQKSHHDLDIKKRYTEEQIIRAINKNIVKLINIEEAGDINYSEIDRC